MALVFTSWLIFLPFVVWQGMYEGPKVIWFLIGGFFLSIYWIVRAFKFKKNLKFLPSDYLYILWLLSLLVSSLFGIHPFLSIVGTSYRHQGVLFFLTLWLSLKTLEILPKDKTQKLGKYLLAAVLLESFIVFSQFVFGKLSFGRPLGTLGDASAASGFIAIGSYFIFKNLTGKKLYFVGLVLLLILFLTGSRAGLVSYMIIFVGFLFSQSKKVSRKVPLFIFSTLLVSVFLIFIYIGKLRPESQFEDRPLFWQMAVNFIEERPLIGWGLESQEYLYNQEFAKEEMPLSGMIVDRAHNLFLDLGIWSGLPGFILFVSWFFLRLARIAKKKDYLKVGGLLSWLFFSTFQPLGVVHWILLIVLLSL